jgi:hypothetical protein
MNIFSALFVIGYGNTTTLFTLLFDAYIMRTTLVNYGVIFNVIEGLSITTSLA